MTSPSPTPAVRTPRPVAGHAGGVPGGVHTLEILLAVGGLAIGLIYLATRPVIRSHWKPLGAALALIVGTGGLIAAVWSPAVSNALARFVLSPGLGSLAALAAAALALYGVIRQMEARRTEQEAAEERNRADQYATHFRWVCERVLESTRSTDTQVIDFLIEDLFDRAVSPRDEEAAIALLRRHVDRLQTAPVVADGTGGPVTKATGRTAG